MDVSAISSLPPEQFRAVLPPWLSGFIAGEDAAARNLVRMQELVAGWSDAECISVAHAFDGLGDDHRVYPAHPSLRGLSRHWCRDAVLDPVVEGIDHLRCARVAGPTMILGNHLSYFDANALDAALAWGGHTDLADRIVAAAGPKVYQDLFRLLAAACLNTLPVPQSATLDRGAQRIAPRELARRALQGVQAAGDAMQAGYVPLVYPEGSRTRTGRLAPFIRGVHRWLRAVEGTRVVPLAISGTQTIMPIGDQRLSAGHVLVRFGAPLQVGPDGSSREVLDAVHAALADLLPVHLQPR